MGCILREFTTRLTLVAAFISSLTHFTNTSPLYNRPSARLAVSHGHLPAHRHPACEVEGGEPANEEACCGAGDGGRGHPHQNTAGQDCAGGAMIGRDGIASPDKIDGLDGIHGRCSSHQAGIASMFEMHVVLTS